MQPIPNTKQVYRSVAITEIGELAYESLHTAIENNETITFEDEEEEPYVEEPIVEEPDVTIEFIRESKLNEMSSTCRRTIENGFDLELRNEIHHFSLDTQDQLNLISLSAMA